MRLLRTRDCWRPHRGRRAASGWIFSAVFLVGFSVTAQQTPGPDPEARVSLDLKDAKVANVVSLLGAAAGIQTVVDPDVSCALTLKLREARWQQALESSLKACRLGYEGLSAVLRVAPLQRLADEAAAKRRVEEAREPNRNTAISIFRLSHARAAEIAPLLKRYVSPRGQVSYDARTNTLIVVD